MRRRRSPFTLIEIMVTMALVVLIGSLLGLAGTRMFQEKQFELSLKKISEELALTETLALTYQIDIKVLFQKKRGELFLIRETEDPPPKIAFLFKKPLSLPGLQLEGSAKPLHFYGNHHKKAPPTLIFRASQRKKSGTIDLRFFSVG